MSSEKESFLSKHSTSIMIISFIVFAAIAFTLINHERLALSSGIDSSTIKWADSQTECKYLNQFYNDLGLKDTWFKSAGEKEVIKKMGELKC